MRPLGGMEYTYWLMSLSSSTNFAVAARLEGAVSSDRLSKALDLVQKAHPLLNVSIVSDRASGARFVSSKPNPIPLIVERLPDESDRVIRHGTPLLRYIEAEKARRFDTENGPLMRCCLLIHDAQTTTLLVIFHHSIADGLAGVGLVKEVVAVLNDLSSSPSVSLPHHPEIGPVERYLPPSARGVRGVWRMMRYGFWLNMIRGFFRPVHVPVVSAAQPHERTDRFIFTRMSLTESTAVFQAARARGVTVHALLSAAQLLAVKRAYPSKSTIRAFVLSLVDLRSRLGVDTDGECLDILFSFVETYHRITRDTELFALAQAVQMQMRLRFDEGFHYYYFPSMAGLLKATQRLRPLGERGSRIALRQGALFRPPVMAVSNLGRVSTPIGNSPIRLSDISFAVPLSTSGHFGSAVNTFDGRLRWNFTFVEPLISRECAVALASHSVEVIKQSCL